MSKRYSKMAKKCKEPSKDSQPVGRVCNVRCNRWRQIMSNEHALAEGGQNYGVMPEVSYLLSFPHI